MDIRRHNFFAITLAATLCAAAFALLVPTAHAGFTASTPVANNVDINLADNPIASDPTGRATVVWYENDGEGSSLAKGRRVAATGVAGPVLTLSPPGEVALHPTVASGTGGRSFATWRSAATESADNGVKGRWIEANGSLGPILTLLTPDDDNDAVELQAVVSNAGVATVLWRNSGDGNKLVVRRVAADGSLSTPVPLGSGGNEPRIAALPDGSTVAIWRDGILEGNVVSPGGTAGTVFDLGQTCGSCFSQALAVDANGDGIAAWRQYHSAEDEFSLVARRLGQTGTPTGDEFTVDPAAKNNIGNTINVSADTQDDFVVAWDRPTSLDGDTVAWARRLDETGTFAGPAQPLSSAADRGSSPVAVLDDRGPAAVGFVGDTATQGRRIGTSGAPLAPAVNLFGGGDLVFGAGAPAAGVAAFLSETQTLTSHRIDIKRYLAPPVCSPSQTKVVQGKPIAVPLSCTGPAIEGAKVTVAPKHGKVGVFNPVTRTLRYTPTPGYAGPDSFSYRALNDGGPSNVAKVQIAVGKDTVKPVVTKLRLEKTPKGLAFAIEYSERSRSKVTVKQGGKKLGTVRSKKLRLRATIAVKGDLLAALKEGGTFNVRGVATDAAGNVSLPKIRTVVR